MFECVTVLLDLPQVDLMNFRVEYVRPRSGRCLGREAAERATKKVYFQLCEKSLLQSESLLFSAYVMLAKIPNYAYLCD